MATSNRPKNTNPKNDPDEKDGLTFKGYTKFFETCEDDSQVYQSLSKILEQVDVDVWKTELSSRGHYDLAKDLFTYWDDKFSSESTLGKVEYIKFIEIFSLLENIFRNVLIRPYVPAYRTINMDCGRYRSFVTKKEESLFNRLNFCDNSRNLLTYIETDPLKTIIYAITCGVFWHVLSMKLKKHH